MLTQHWTLCRWLARTELNSDITAVNDLFSTVSIGQHNNPFTQSCFPRINLENCVEKSANVSDISCRAP
uniref:Bm7761 n=1 Tax=Brugia malayi TaxID=6279 RepID=A0A0J9YBZ7_BRUMA|nr:Bm7761 [Brugia malayi]